VRHEISRNAIVWAIEQYFHRFNLLRRFAGKAGSDDLRLSSFISLCKRKNRRPYGLGGGVCVKREQCITQTAQKMPIY